MSQEFKKLEKLVREKSKAQIAVELGYRSPTTVVTWFKNKKIPITALARVREYLETNRKEKHT